ncbi:protein apnoia [Linepithema humile]|uniref:protein apnoia n=1 Tax=Linepithema humile TaxID=83485 RepID=UPI0006237F7A|nr:PREDICTED: uncharacterized protein LOC105677079 [Linepithema humile]
MKAIGRILACVLLATAFVKNVLTANTANIKFSTEQSNEAVRSNVTRLELVSKSSPLNSDIEDPRNIQDDVFKNEENYDFGLEEARTFGHKRFQLMLMPMMYKMGAMMTLLMVLTAISVKGLIVGLILLVLKLSAFLAKFHTGHSAWSPSQPIHVHVHNSFPHAHAQAYHGWIPASGPGDEDHYYYKG